MSQTDGIRVRVAPEEGQRLGKLRAGVQLLHFLALLGGVFALVYLAFAFWNITEAIAIASGKREGFGAVLPLVLATLGSWSIMYLLHDKLGILGSAKARATLLPAAEALYTDTDPAPLARHFVELRTQAKKGPFKTDWGWLVVFPDRLEFVGEQQTITLEKRLVAGPPQREPNAAGLLPTWLDLPVRADWRGVALLCRDSARSLSDTARDAAALETSLQDWLMPTITPSA